MTFKRGDIVAITIKQGPNKDKRNFGIIDHYDQSMCKWKINMIFGPTRNCFRANKDVEFVCAADFLYGRLNEMVTAKV